MGGAARTTPRPRTPDPGRDTFCACPPAAAQPEQPEPPRGDSELSRVPGLRAPNDPAQQRRERLPSGWNHLMSRRLLQRLVRRSAAVACGATPARRGPAGEPGRRPPTPARAGGQRESRAPDAGAREAEAQHRWPDRPPRCWIACPRESPRPPNDKLSSRRAANHDRCPPARWEARMGWRSAAATGSAPRRVPARCTPRGATPPHTQPPPRTGRHQPRSRCRGCLRLGRRTTKLSSPARISELWVTGSNKAGRVCWSAWFGVPCSATGRRATRAP